MKRREFTKSLALLPFVPSFLEEKEKTVKHDFIDWVSSRYDLLEDVITGPNYEGGKKQVGGFHMSKTDHTFNLERFIDVVLHGKQYPGHGATTAQALYAVYLMNKQNEENIIWKVSSLKEARNDIAKKLIRVLQGLNMRAPEFFNKHHLKVCNDTYVHFNTGDSAVWGTEIEYFGEEV